MKTTAYTARRGQLEEYFDRTAVEAWASLTSDAPVSRIRATVRAGRDRMRETLLSYLPQDLRGQRLLDAGCGTGALALEAARRGAEVVAVDISPTLIQLARERTGRESLAGWVDFRVGDMLDPSFGKFEWAVMMDSLIHYEPDQVVDAVGQLSARIRRGFAFTFAPATTLLRAMHTVGKVFPRGDRSPDIVPVGERALTKKLSASDALEPFRIGRSERIASGFYTSQTMELVRA